MQICSNICPTKFTHYIAHANVYCFVRLKTPLWIISYSVLFKVFHSAERSSRKPDPHSTSFFLCLPTLNSAFLNYFFSLLGSVPVVEVGFSLFTRFYSEARFACICCLCLTNARQNKLVKFAFSRINVMPLVKY